MPQVDHDVEHLTSPEGVPETNFHNRPNSFKVFSPPRTCVVMLIYQLFLLDNRWTNGHMPYVQRHYLTNHFYQAYYRVDEEAERLQRKAATTTEKSSPEFINVDATHVKTPTTKESEE